MTDELKQLLYIEQRKKAMLRVIQRDSEIFGAEAVGLRPEHLEYMEIEVQSVTSYQAALEEEKIWHAKTNNLHISDAYQLMLNEANSRIDGDWLGQWHSGETDLFNTFYADYCENCNACRAQGALICNSCNGEGGFTCREHNCSQGYIACSCNGQGGFCSSCKGKGRLWQDYSLPGGDERRLDNCYTCNGSGRIGYCIFCNDQAGNACNRCNGRGFLLCSGCSGRRYFTCSSCNGNRMHYGRFNFKIKVKKIEETFTPPDEWARNFPNLMKSAPTITLNQKTVSRKDAARLYRTLSVPVFLARRSVDEPIHDILMAGDEDPIYRSKPYVERLASHVIRAFENDDLTTVASCEFGRELMGRARNGVGRTPLMDKYNMPPSLVDPILKLCDEVHLMLKNEARTHS